MSSLTPTLLARLQTQTQTEEAWGRLTELCGPLVYGRCRRAGVPPQDVADLGQEVWIDVMKGIRAFRRDRPGDTFRGWLARITRRRIADYWRGRKRVREGEASGGSAALERLAAVPDSHDPGADDPAGPGPEADGIEADDAGALRGRALQLIADRFETRTWRACWLVVMAGRPAAVVAQELGMSVNAVRVAKSKVLTCLREEFGDLLD